MMQVQELIDILLREGTANTDVLIKVSEANRMLVVDMLLRALETPDSKKRYNALWVLQTLKNEKSIEPIIKCLNDEDDEVRWSAASVLGVFDNLRAIHALIGALSDSSRNVRFSATMSLRKFKDPNVVNALIAKLNDEGIGIREQAIYSLVEIGDKKAVRPLIPYVFCNDIDLRRIVICALGELGDARAITPLAYALQDWSSDGFGIPGTEHFIPGGFPFICHYAAWALEEIGTELATKIANDWRATDFPMGGKFQIENLK